MVKEIMSGKKIRRITTDDVGISRYSCISSEQIYAAIALYKKEKVQAILDLCRNFSER